MRTALFIFLLPLTVFAQFNATDIAFVQNTLICDEVMTYKQNVVANGGTVSDTTLKYLDEFVRGCKADGTWTKLQEIYPITGDNVPAAATKLKWVTTTPYLTNSGNFAATNYAETGSTGGLKGDATTKYMDTGWNPVAQSVSATNLHLSVYVRGTETNGTSRTMLWAYQSAVTVLCGLGWVNSGTQEAGILGGTSSSYSPTPGTTSLESWMAVTVVGNRTARFYHNATEIPTAVTANNDTFPNLSLYLSSDNRDGTPAAFSSRYMRFVTIGTGLSTSDLTALNTRIQRLQTLLGRNV